MRVAAQVAEGVPQLGGGAPQHAGGAFDRGSGGASDPAQADDGDEGEQPPPEAGGQQVEPHRHGVGDPERLVGLHETEVERQEQATTEVAQGPRA